LIAGERIAFRDIPTTPKSIVKAQPAAFYSDATPPSEGWIKDRATSGSSGEPLLLKKTERHYLVNAQENQRLRASWGDDPKAVSLKIDWRVADSQASTATKAGDRSWIVASPKAEDWIAALQETKASALSCYPSQALTLLESAPTLEHLRFIDTVGEVTPEALESALAARPNIRRRDTYGSVETGIIAVTCPHCGNYHLADRHLIVEVLDEQDRSAAIGAMGRVVATPLFNLAMPLLRYELGDYAIPAETPHCPVSTRALARIVGRDRDLFRLSSGERVTPQLPAAKVLALGVRKFKLVQTTLQNVDFLYVPSERNLTVDHDVIQRLVQTSVSPLLHVTPVRVDEIAATASGKYLMHESLVG
jgi:phenylacetate-CoA ligase